MKLSSAVPEIIDVPRHSHRGLARLFVMKRVTALFNLLIPKPPDCHFYHNELQIFIQASGPIEEHLNARFKALSDLGFFSLLL